MRTDFEIDILLNKLEAAGIYQGTHFLLIIDHGGIDQGHYRSTDQKTWSDYRIQ